jgi:hypothetical protein
LYIRSFKQDYCEREPSSRKDVPREESVERSSNYAAASARMDDPEGRSWADEMEVDYAAGPAEDARWEGRIRADRTAGGGSDGQEDAMEVAWPPSDEGLRDVVAAEFVVSALPRQSVSVRGRRQEEQWAEVHAEFEDSMGARRWVPNAMSGVLLWRRGGGVERWYCWDGRKCKYADSAARWLQVGADGQQGACHSVREEFKRRRFCGTQEAWRACVQNSVVMRAPAVSRSLSSVSTEGVHVEQVV